MSEGGCSHRDAARSGERAKPTGNGGTGGTVGSQGVVGGDPDSPHEPSINFHELYAQMVFYDDMKGGALDKEKVIAARRLEMDYFRKMVGLFEGPIDRGQEAWDEGDHHEVD